MRSMERDPKSVHTDLRIGPTWPILNMTTKIRLKFNNKKLFSLISEFQELANWDHFSDTYTATYGLNTSHVKKCEENIKEYAENMKKYPLLYRYRLWDLREFRDFPLRSGSGAPCRL